ncbi:uncharacterized protein LOC119406642 [Rhipicephalus sanguineus]|uniref:uncharacterized protein LOC119406642 n=1 Tax=Rhipicephalus sanguineus TaxID=34632 RepID=UPI0018953944|nr:uncharacterized protein LOC119406642 [Rhipicephalus sanguineus]
MAVEDNAYEIVLPTLPTGRVVNNTLLLHGDVRERPYKVEDFRDALATCLRCHGTGHVRRDCRVPRCSKCRRCGHADADCVRTYASATGRPKDDENEELMDVAEAEEAARGIDEAGKRSGPEDTSTPSSGDAPKGDGPVDQPAVGDMSGTKGHQPATQVVPAASGCDTRKGKAPTLHRGAGESSVSTDASPAVTSSSPAPKVGEPTSLNEPQPEKSGVHTPPNVTAASKRPHPTTSNDGTEATVTANEEPPAKSAQVRRSSLRPRPNVPADKRGGNAEHVGQVQVPAPDGNAGDGIV